ncbi:MULTISPECIES: DUF4062 domain-containing protein [Deinococcus]|uniref:DUF4062 domain-containing protein n=1 Tax=Deinococcus rufus TaxID=2136097 RepID=A0ABV7Z8Y1_9DEIO|nr:DUF4062 domain-containing protein [Deinococcus sp. AB2017081]WQE96192.1 DUF4062 domain-containing protein [Deinococcus sp. AB2017081]
MEKKYTVFVSSTFLDLQEHRNKVIGSILKLGHIPLGMEAFPASDASQWEIIRQTIDRSDYYVLIPQKYYGSIDKEVGISYTEKEYNYAVESKIPVLTFIVRDEVLLSEKHIETTQKRKKMMENLKAKVSAGRLVDFWSTADELAAKVNAALIQEITRNPRPGWVRGGDPALVTPTANQSVAKRPATLTVQHIQFGSFILIHNISDDTLNIEAVYISGQEIPYLEMRWNKVEAPKLSLIAPRQNSMLFFGVSSKVSFNGTSLKNFPDWQEMVIVLSGFSASSSGRLTCDVRIPDDGNIQIRNLMYSN